MINILMMHMVEPAALSGRWAPMYTHMVIPTADGSALYWADSSGNHTGY